LGARGGLVVVPLQFGGTPLGLLQDRFAKDVALRLVHGLDVLDLAVVVGDLELDLINPADDADVGALAGLLELDFVGLLRLRLGGPQQQRQSRQPPTASRHDALPFVSLRARRIPLTPNPSPSQGRGGAAVNAPSRRGAGPSWPRGRPWAADLVCPSPCPGRDRGPSRFRSPFTGSAAAAPVARSGPSAPAAPRTPGPRGSSSRRARRRRWRTAPPA